MLSWPVQIPHLTISDLPAGKINQAEKNPCLDRHPSLLSRGGPSNDGENVLLSNQPSFTAKTCLSTTSNSFP